MTTNDTYEIVYWKDPEKHGNKNGYLHNNYDSPEYAQHILECLYDSLERYKAEGNRKWINLTYDRIAFYKAKLRGEYKHVKKEPEEEKPKRERKPIGGELTETQKEFIRQNYKWYTLQQFVQALGCHVKHISAYLKELEADEAS